MHAIKIKQIKKAYLRSYTLSFDKDLNLIVKIPIFFSKKNVDEVVEKHRDWIEKNFSILLSKQTEAMKHTKEIRQGEVFKILEEEYILKFKFVNRVRITSYLEESYLITELPEKYKEKTVMEVLDKKVKEEIKDSLVKLFKKIASTYVYSKVKDVTKLYKTEFNSISIKDQSSKWGSCSSQKNLNFNWRLIFAPYKVIDYVIVHEICHLIEMNHSKDFWNLVKQTSKNYKEYRKWLKDNQDILKNLI